MIKFRNYTPKVYYDESRDFQLLGRLFDTVLNSVKTSADLIYNIPFSPNSDDQLLSLLALTLGFKLRSNKYTTRQLRALCSIFPEALRKKGSMDSIILICNALLNAEGSSDVVHLEFDSTEYTLNIFIPTTFSDLSIINDALSYVMPAGISYRLLQERSLEETSTTTVVPQHQVQVIGDDRLHEDYTSLFNAKANVALTGTFISYPAESEATPSEATPKPGFINTAALYLPPQTAAKTGSETESEGDEQAT